MQMKETIAGEDNLENRISYYHLVVFVMALPFDRLYSELALISFCIHTLLHLRPRRVTWQFFGLLSVVYLLTMVGTLYTRHYDEAFYEWERQLAILLFPLCFFFTRLDPGKYYLSIVRAMAASCFFALLYLYYIAFSRISEMKLPASAIVSNIFINHNFAEPIDMHATYFSMYIALAALGTIQWMVKVSAIGSRILNGIILCVLTLGLIQLSSRSVLIAVGIIITLVVPFFLFEGRKRVWVCLLSLFIGGIFFIAINTLATLKTRFIIDLKQDLTQASVRNNTLEPRIRRWECAWELIKRSPVYGHGSGSEIALLKEIYFQKKLFNSYIHKLNAHNQYLSLAIKTGFIGLFIWLITLVAGFRLAIRNRNALFAGFLVIISVVSFSENILDANKGIFFFAFFFSLLYFAEKNRDEAT